MKLQTYTISLILVGLLLIPSQALALTRPVILSETIDQSQESETGGVWFDKIAWQEFKPEVKKLIRVEVKIMVGGGDQPPLRLYVEQPLGSILASKELPASSIPTVSDWVAFDISDIKLEPDESYYIKLSFSPGGQYYWSGSNNNPYTDGISSRGENWDYCFRTVVDKSKTRIDFSIFDQIPYLVKILKNM